MAEEASSRNGFIQAMVSSIAAKQDLERQILEVPTNELSSSALAHLDDVALDAADSLCYDFPSPTVNGVESLIKAIMLCTGPKPRESLFVRTFSISARFLDGIVFCCSRHTVKKEKDSSEGRGALPSSLSSELAALVFIKCVRFLLEAPLHVASRMLLDDSLDIIDQVIIPDTASELDIDERLKNMTGESMAMHVVEEDRVSEEVWAAELDDDDVAYEGVISQPVESDKRSNIPDGGYGGRGYDKVLTPQDCQNRLGHLVRRFCSNFLTGISAVSWKKYGLVSDICCIIKHFRPSSDSVSSSLLLVNPKLEDGTTLSCLPPWVEEAWVEYTYALRDNVVCDAYDVSALEFLLSQLDPVGEDEVMSPARCISFVILHTIVGSQSILPLSSLRAGLLERLEVLSECFGSITDALTTIAASGTKASVDAQVGAEVEPSDPLPSSEESSLLHEQAKVLLVLLGFAVGISLSSETVTEAKVLTAMPPPSTMIRSQVYRGVLKLVAVLAVKSLWKEKSQPDPYLLGIQLLIILTSHSTELADFAIRAPMTSTLIERDSPLTALLTLALTASGVSQDSKLGSTLDELAMSKCKAVLAQDEGVTSLLGALAHWNMLAIRRLQSYLNSVRGSWFRDWVLSAQRSIVERPIKESPSPVPTSREEASTSCNAEVNLTENDDVSDSRDVSKDEDSIKGPEKRRMVSRSDAIKGAKLLLEKSAGDNKTD